MSITQSQRPKRSHVFFLKLALGVFVLIFAAMIFMNQMKAKGIAEFLANKPETASPVTAMTVAASEWTPVIETTGLVRPNQGAMLSSQNAGTVARVLVSNGQQVKKGDLLVELDSSVERASLAAAEAQLPSLRATYQRYASLIASGSVSRQELDSAKAAYDAQAANINSLKAAIERRQIVAPFDGKAGIVKVNVGQYVNVGTEIVRVEDRSSMKVDFAIAQNLLDRLHVGQKVTATADARKGETFAAKITAIEPAINTSTGLIDVQATFEPEDGAKLLSGMFTRLNVALPTEHSQIVVPQVAVSYNMYGESLYVLTALSDEDIEKLGGAEKAANMYRAKSITVFTKDRQGIYAQLKGDEVKVGDKIVTGGQQNLSNGALVSVADKEGVGTQQPAKKTNL
ncbi:efflux transporter, RND family, MFP subunit [Haemophilus pittmaniae HK 85]|uniref:Efflux transporter, RND family, MFP subunit n=1 Tax=Haemophilus pittmaniae HK 85 TaxID=1035188 RepID=F9Q7Q1_9PAST|nr:efflux RND transporter periplasmic adaptor subunit [Haemophilus pittmaniae]EGV06581.1 efflux transporter, RND family, MFP subunit [Haemophilus pittmaniae HK 85]MBS6026725.1 efflux RND transporter periplasmic adaptor subunit [Haemophilus pittmaniae]SNV71662.1 membrane-fusion protein [Haemophilus pittmaniae]